MEIDTILQSISSKLQEMECPYLCSTETDWTKQFLLKQSLNRSDLIDWILSKLNYNINGAKTNMASEAKIKDLHSALSALGVCTKNSIDVVQGTAPIMEQTKFWEKLVNIVQKKWSIESGKENKINQNGQVCRSVSELYEMSQRKQEQMYESVKLGDLYNTKLQLFPSYLLKECKTARGKVEEALAKLNKHSQSSKSQQDCIKFHSLDMDYEKLWKSHDKLLDEKIDQIKESLDVLNTSASVDFANTYNNLKGYLLDVTEEELFDVGPQFEDCDKKMESFLEFHKSLKLIKSSNLELKQINSEMKAFEITNTPLSDAVLGEYIDILQNGNDEKKL